MNAVVVSNWGGPEVLEFTEINTPVPKAGEVLIQTAATSVNFADIKSRSGPYRGKQELPFVPGIDVAGTVAAVGPGVSDIQVGDRVIAFPKRGSYAEFVIADSQLTVLIPPSMDFQTAAASPIVSFTAFNVLHRVAGVRPGETVLVHSAAGGVGSVAVQLAKLLGAGTVIGAVGDDSKAEFVQSLGADYTVNYRKSPFAEFIQEVTGGKGVNVILDPQGGDIANQSLQCLGLFGRIVQYGNREGQSALNTADLSTKCQSVIGYSFGSIRKHRPDTVKHTAEAVLPYLVDGRLKMFIDKTFPLREASEAHGWVESRKSQGKVLLVP